MPSLSLVRTPTQFSATHFMAFRPAAAWLCGLLFLTAALCSGGCGTGELPVATNGLSLSGSVHGGQQPVTGALLQLYAAGTTGDASVATPLIGAHLTTSDGSGNAGNANANAGNLLNSLPAGSFSISGAYTCPSASAPVYLVATGGNPGLGAGTVNPALAMLAVLGRCGDLTTSTNVSINELTTVGSLAPLAPYMNDLATLGSGSADAPQFSAAMDLVRTYTNTADGSVPGSGLQAGFYASSTEIITLGDILAQCINSDGNGVCQQLFALTTPPGGTAPTDTVTATLDILKYPTHNTAAIFQLLAAGGPFQPTLSSAPAAWTLPINPVAATPSISPASGSYAVAPTVTLTTSTPGAGIYYTLNGSTPTTASTLYTAPFNLTNTGAATQTVQAIAAGPGFGPSGKASASYTIPAAGTTTNLVFLTQPGNETLGTALPTFRLGFVDSYGTAIKNAYVPISLSIGTNPSRTALTGTTSTNTLTDGTVSVSGVYLNAIGVGYTLKATWSNGVAISAPFDVVSPPITLTTIGNLIGAGTTLPGSFTLTQPAPAGGLTVALSSSNAAIVSITPATVTVAAGQTTGAFTYSSAGAGTATLRASATGFADGTASETTTASFINLGTLPSPSPGASAALNLTLTTPAPSGGVTVALTSGTTAVATVTATATFPAGSTTPVANPQLTAKTYGPTLLTATATGYGPAVGTATITGTATVTPSPLTLGVSGSATGTITLGAAAPTGGVTFAITTDSASVAGPQISNVQVVAGATSATFIVLGYGVGTTTLRLNSPGFPEATVPVTVSGSFSVISNYTSQPAAKLYVPNTLTLSSTPGAPVDITLTSSNPAVLLLSTNPNVVGTGSLTVTGFTGRTINFYEQGQVAGSASITITASAGYTTLVTPVTVNQTLLILQPLISNNSLPSNAAAGEIDVSLAEASSNGSFVGSCSTGTRYGSDSPLGCRLNPGVTLTADVTSSNTAVGTITTSPVTLSAGSQLAATGFQPLSAGTANVTLTQPAGFYTSAAYPFYLTSTAALTVTQASFTLPSQTSAGTFAGVTTLLNATLSSMETRSGGATVTVTVGNGSLASISTNAAVPGGSSLTLTGITSALPTIYLQGLATGSTTLTFSAPGYTSVSPTLTVGTKSIIFTDSYALSGYPTDAPQSIEVGLACPAGVCFLNPGTSSQFTISSSNPSVASFSNPITLASGTTKVNATLNVLTAGTTSFSIATVAPPLAPASSSYGTITRSGTFSASTFTLQPSTTGANLYVAASFSVNRTAANATTVTLTSSNPAVALLSTNAGSLGSAALTFPNYKTGAMTYYVQGLAPGTSTLTISGAPFTTTTATVTVDPSGVVFSPNTTITTTSFSAATSLTIYLAILDPLSGLVVQYCQTSTCALNPGTSISAPVTSSDPSIAAVGTSPVVFAAGSSASATSSITPYEVGQVTLTIGQPAGFTVSAAGISTKVVNVTGSVITVNPITLAAGLYVAQNVNLPVTPTRPVSVTVTVADGSLAKLSTDPNVMSTTSTLTFSNITASAGGSTGGVPTFYVQGVGSGYTRLMISASGYIPSIATIGINKLGLTLPAASGVQQYVTSSVSGNPLGSTPFTLSHLDPYSLSTVADCAANGCTFNPGAATPSLTLAAADPSTGTFPQTATAYDSTKAYTTIPFTPVQAGFTTYSLATQSAGYFNTSTPVRRTGLGAVLSSSSDTAHALFIAASDIDAGVGIQVLSAYALSATAFNYYNTPFTITVADPTMAVVSNSATVAGNATLTYTTFSYISVGFYVQGLKAGTTTITISGAGYASRTVTLNVRPAGFTIKLRDISAPANPRTGAYYGATATVKPALLNAQGQWLADAQLNPQTATVTVPISSANTAIGTVLQSSLSFAASSTQATFEYDGVAAGSTIVSLGTPSATFIQGTTYQTINAVTR